MAPEATPQPMPSTPLYAGPIFDADTHFWETDDAWSAYLSEKTRQDWGITFKNGVDGQFAMYVGPRKVEISADHLFEDGRVPAPALRGAPAASGCHGIAGPRSSTSRQKAGMRP